MPYIKALLVRSATSTGKGLSDRLPKLGLTNILQAIFSPPASDQILAR